MKWLKKLLRRKQSSPFESFPMQVQIPGYPYAVHIFYHQITYQESIRCWTIISDGLWSLGQREFILTVRCLPDEDKADVPVEILFLFRDLFRVAGRHDLVSIGGYTQFENPVLGTLFKGAIYVAPQALPGVTLPSAPSMAMILVSQDELELAKECGVARVAALLGREYIYYPCPTWADRQRTVLPNLRESRSKSVVPRSYKLAQKGAHIYQHNNCITLRLATTSAEQIRENLEAAPDNVAMTILAQIDPRANACLTWYPEQADPFAISPPHSDGSRMCGGFLALLPGMVDASVGILEDGFFWRLTNETWAAVRHALETTQPLKIDSFPDNMSLAIEWTHPALICSTTGIVMDQKPKEELDAVSNIKVILFTPMDTVEQEIGLQKLLKYIADAQRLMHAHFEQQEESRGINLAVHVMLLARQSRPASILTNVAGEVPELLSNELVAFVEKLQAVPAPAVNRGPVRFALVAKLRGGSREPLYDLGYVWDTQDGAHHAG